MLGFKIEYKLEPLGDDKARVHKRIVTPFCYFRCRHKDYSYEVFKGVLHIVPMVIPIFVWVRGGSSSTHLVGRWKLAQSSGQIFDLLESHKKSFAKRLRSPQ